MRRFLEIITIISLLFGVAPATTAQETIQGRPRPCVWSQPVNISETPDFYTFHGALVGDSFGYVHAFWGENASHQEDMTVFPYIVYRHWDGFKWSSPADILVAKSTSAMTANHALTSSDGSRLYVAWTDALGFYVSWAERQSATDARAWQTAQIVSGGPPRAALTIDNQDVLHALYASPYTQDSIEYRKSADGGETWTEPSTVWTISGPDKVLANTSLVTARDGTLHAAWQASDGTRTTPTSFPYMIMYTHSTDGGVTWDPPMEFTSREAGYADPAIFEDRAGELHMVWNGAAGMPDGRFYSWSTDDGVSWAPIRRLPGSFLGGRSGFPQIVEDSSGTLHVFHDVEMRSKGALTRYVSQYLTDHEWSVPVEVPDIDGADVPALTIVGGNQLFALMWAPPGEVLYSTCLLNSPALAPLPTPTLLPPTLATQPAASPTPSVSHAITEPHDTPRNLGEVDSSGAKVTNQAFPVLAGTLSAVLVVALSIAFARRRAPGR